MYDVIHCSLDMWLRVTTAKPLPNLQIDAKTYLSVFVYTYMSIFDCCDRWPPVAFLPPVPPLGMPGPRTYSTGKQKFMRPCGLSLESNVPHMWRHCHDIVHLVRDITILTKAREASTATVDYESKEMSVECPTIIRSSITRATRSASLKLPIVARPRDRCSPCRAYE